MSKESAVPEGLYGHSGTYAYPSDLARLVSDQWNRTSADLASAGSPPAMGVLEHFLSACYQASLLREEDRPVTFRAILAAPAGFARNGRPPESLLSLPFAQAIAFDSAALRRLSVAASTERTLIGVSPDERGGLEIWGLVDSGTRWLRNVWGGRRTAAPLPPVPVVHVDAPGSLAVFSGQEMMATLRGGKLSVSRIDVFDSVWLPEAFAGFVEGILTRHEAAANVAVRESPGERWAPLEPDVSRRIAERMLKRVVAVLRAARHGGTIAFVPDARVMELTAADPFIDLKYRFADVGCRSAFPSLVLDMLNRLAAIHARPEAPLCPVGWREFEQASDDVLATLDEALFETAYLIAGLASADGAVVFSNRTHELLGFSGMIGGRLPPVLTVARALDLEGRSIVVEETASVGARHRSAYRLAAGVPGTVVVVISQDGGVRFVTQKAGGVIYWEQD